MFTKAIKGMRYGCHVDNAFMSSGRADLSFTLFLNEKKDYEGGELIIENINSTEKFKLMQERLFFIPAPTFTQ